MQLSIITPEKLLFSADAEMVTIPGTEGEFGVLAGHAPFISTIKPGIITIDLAGGEKRKIAVVSGLAEAVPERCTVLVDFAEDVSNVSPEAAASRFAAAKAQADAAVTDDEKQKAEKELAVAGALCAA